MHGHALIVAILEQLENCFRVGIGADSNDVPVLLFAEQGCVTGAQQQKTAAYFFNARHADVCVARKGLFPAYGISIR